MKGNMGRKKAFFSIMNDHVNLITVNHDTNYDDVITNEYQWPGNSTDNMELV